MLPEQLLLPEIGAPPLDRLFFAVLPDPAAAQRAAEMAATMRSGEGLTGRALPMQLLHVILHRLGDHAGFPAALAEQAQAAAAQVRQTHVPVHFDRVGSFLGRRPPLVLRGGNAVIPLIAFQHSLGEAMIRCGLGRFVSPRYTPHMTLLQDRRFVEARLVEPVSWTAQEFVLVHSQLGRDRHAIIARWPLHDPTNC